MKNLVRELKTIRIISCLISAIVIVIGLGFSYLIAQLDDAPGVIFIGGTATLVVTLFVYGFGEVIIQLKRTNAILSDILANKEK